MDGLARIQAQLVRLALSESVSAEAINGLDDHCVLVDEEERMVYQHLDECARLLGLITAEEGEELYGSGTLEALVSLLAPHERADLWVRDTEDGWSYDHGDEA